MLLGPGKPFQEEVFRKRWSVALGLCCAEVSVIDRIKNSIPAG
jgi:hypothetical protein